MGNHLKLRHIICRGLIFAFFINTIAPAGTVQAQVDPMPFMPAPGVMVNLSPQFSPAYLKGIVVHPDNPFEFDFIVYRGDKPLSDAQKRVEYTKLTKYFLASLTIPDDQWVNLSPYEKDRIIKDDFAKTEMGRDLLTQDYLLKQITASLIYPENNLGKKFWNKVYAQAQKQYGTTNIPVNTFNKVWILPDDALIYEKGNTAYILKNHLRVMLEEDYLSLSKHNGVKRLDRPLSSTSYSSVIARSEATKQSFSPHSIASNIIRQIVLPELEREVNEDANFAPLRQVYSGMLLATWFKRTLKTSLLGQIYANKGKTRGVDYDQVSLRGQNPKQSFIIDQIYQRYLQAYKKGVFNFIKEDPIMSSPNASVGDPKYATIPRKYFSGGTIGYGHAQIAAIYQIDQAQSVKIRSTLLKGDVVNVVLSSLRAKLHAVVQYPELDWVKAQENSELESTRNGERPRQENYLKNLEEERTDFLSLLKRMAKGDSVSLNDFIYAFRQLNRILLTGRNGKSFYYPVSMYDHIKPNITEVAGQFRNDDLARRKLEFMLVNLKQFFSRSFIRKSSLRDVVLHIINFYSAFIKAPDATFHTYLLFKYGNNSIAMNMVNAMLRLYHLNGIAHDNLDSELMEGAGLMPQHFVDHFLENVYLANPGVNFNVNAFEYLKATAASPEQESVDRAMTPKIKDAATNSQINISRNKKEIKEILKAWDLGQQRKYPLEKLLEILGSTGRYVLLYYGNNDNPSSILLASHETDIDWYSDWHIEYVESDRKGTGSGRELVRKFVELYGRGTISAVLNYTGEKQDGKSAWDAFLKSLGFRTEDEEFYFRPAYGKYNLDGLADAAMKTPSAGQIINNPTVLADYLRRAKNVDELSLSVNTIKKSLIKELESKKAAEKNAKRGQLGSIHFSDVFTDRNYGVFKEQQMSDAVTVIINAVKTYEFDKPAQKRRFVSEVTDRVQVPESSSAVTRKSRSYLRRSVITAGLFGLVGTALLLREKILFPDLQDEDILGADRPDYLKPDERSGIEREAAQFIAESNKRFPGAKLPINFVGNVPAPAQRSIVSILNWFKLFDQNTRYVFDLMYKNDLNLVVQPCTTPQRVGQNRARFTFSFKRPTGNSSFNAQAPITVTIIIDPALFFPSKWDMLVGELTSAFAGIAAARITYPVSQGEISSITKRIWANAVMGDYSFSVDFAGKLSQNFPALSKAFQSRAKMLKGEYEKAKTEMAGAGTDAAMNGEEVLKLLQEHSGLFVKKMEEYLGNLDKVFIGTYRKNKFSFSSIPLEEYIQKIREVEIVPGLSILFSFQDHTEVVFMNNTKESLKIYADEPERIRNIELHIKRTLDSIKLSNSAMTVVGRGTRADAAMNADIKNFMNNYAGTIYYPSSGLDLISLIELMDKFPNVKQFSFVDTLNLSKNEWLKIKLGALGYNNWPQDISEKASVIQKVLKAQYHQLFERIIVAPQQDHRVFSIVLTFNENPALSPRVQGKTVSVRLSIRDLFGVNENFKVIYVKFPDYGGALGRDPAFWNKMKEQLKTRGYLLVSRDNTLQPGISTFTQKGFLPDTPFRTGMYLFDAPGRTGMYLYQKEPDAKGHVDLSRASAAMMGQGANVGPGMEGEAQEDWEKEIEAPKIMGFPEAAAFFEDRMYLPKMANQEGTGVLRVNIVNHQLLLSFVANPEAYHEPILKRLHEIGGFSNRHDRREWISMRLRWNNLGRLNSMLLLPPSLNIPEQQYSSTMLSFLGESRNGIFYGKRYQNGLDQELIIVARLMKIAAINKGIDPNDVEFQTSSYFKNKYDLDLETLMEAGSLPDVVRSDATVSHTNKEPIDAAMRAQVGRGTRTDGAMSADSEISKMSDDEILKLTEKARLSLGYQPDVNNGFYRKQIDFMKSAQWARMVRSTWIEISRMKRHEDFNLYTQVGFNKAGDRYFHYRTALGIIKSGFDLSYALDDALDNGRSVWAVFDPPDVQIEKGYTIERPVVEIKFSGDIISEDYLTVLGWALNSSHVYGYRNDVFLRMHGIDGVLLAADPGVAKILKIKNVAAIRQSRIITTPPLGWQDTKEPVTQKIRGLMDTAGMNDGKRYERNREQWREDLKAKVGMAVNRAANIKFENSNWVGHLFRGRDGSWWLHLHNFAGYDTGIMFRLILDHGKITGLIDPMVESLQVLEFIRLNAIDPDGIWQRWFIQHGMSALTDDSKRELEAFIAKNADVAQWNKSKIFGKQRFHFSVYPLDLAGQAAITTTFIRTRTIDLKNGKFAASKETGIVYDVTDGNDQNAAMNTGILPYSSLKEILNQKRGEVLKRGWWVAFDVDKTTDMKDLFAVDRHLTTLQKIMFEGLDDLNGQVYLTGRIHIEDPMEEGYIYLPRNLSQIEIKRRLDSIRKKFGEETSIDSFRPGRQTVTFAVMKATDIEEEANRMGGDSNYLQVMERTLYDLLRKGKGYPKSAKKTANYGNKTVFHKPPGGIDLNSANLAMTIKRDGRGVPIISQQDLAQLSNIEGLDPVIISIKPASQTALFADLVANP